MSENLEIQKRENGGIVTTPSTVFTFSVEEFDPRKDHVEKGLLTDTFMWGLSGSFIGDVELIPYGFRNNMPQLLRDTVYNNPNIPGIMEKKVQLLWGQGPNLYKEIIADGKPTREFTYDADIQNWLDSWNYTDYLLKVCTDHAFMQGAFHEIICAKSGRIGIDRIHSLAHKNPQWTRLGRQMDSAVATHCFASDSRMIYSPESYELLPLFDKNKIKGRSIFYSRQYSFATDFYAIPTLYGAIPWIRRSTAIPIIIEALSKFSMNAKYHVTSPAAFWDAKRRELQDECASKGEDYSEDLLVEYERLLFVSISETLSGEGNAGKIWHTKNIFAPDGTSLHELGWKIEPIDQNIKEFVDTQIAIANKADGAVSSAVGLHKALAGITAAGSADSGSEQLYAYLMYKLTGVKIPEMLVMQMINTAIKINFPEKNLKLGFFHEEAQRQQDQSSQDRIKNNPQ